MLIGVPFMLCDKNEDVVMEGDDAESANASNSEGMVSI